VAGCCEHCDEFPGSINGGNIPQQLLKNDSAVFKKDYTV
jgi:hypothetical protein